ncbi:2920_t:CDS:2, partial [Gigaspora margarita]
VHLLNEELKKQVENLKNKTDPKNVARIISKMYKDPNKKRELVKELKAKGLSLQKQKRIDKDQWKKGRKKSDLNSVNKILDKVLNSTPEKIDFNQANKRFKKLTTRMTKSEVDQVKLERFEYFLLGDYIIKNYPKSKKNLLKAKKNFQYKCYERVANLHKVIGKHIIELPFDNTFFDGSHGNDDNASEDSNDDNASEDSNDDNASEDSNEEN